MFVPLCLVSLGTLKGAVKIKYIIIIIIFIQKEVKEGRIWRGLWIGTSLARRCDVISLQMRPPKDADPGLRHSKCV